MSSEELEGSTVQLYKGLADNGLVGTVATLDVHHHRDGHTTGNPLSSGGCGVLDDAHVARLAIGNEAAGVEAEAVAVVGIVVAGSSAAAFVAEEVVLGAELGCAACFLQALGHHTAQQLLGLDEADLHVAVGVAVEAELTGHILGQALQHGEVVLGDALLHEGDLGVGALKLTRLAGGGICQHLVELLDELLDGGDELDEALGDEHSAEVVALLSAGGNDVGDVVHHVIQAHLLGLHLLTDEADVGLSLQGALQCDVAGAAAHELDEVPVLAGAVAVALDVSDELAVGLASGVEAEAGLDLLVLQVAVNRLGAADDLYAILLGGIVLSEDAGVGVAVVATDDDECLDVQLAQDLDTLLELLHLLQLRAAGADDVEATGVAVFVDDVSSELHVLMIHEAAGAEDEAVELGGGVDALDTVEEAADNVVTARSLTAAEDDAHVDGRQLLYLASLELDDGESVGVGEQFLNLSLVADTLRGGTFLSFHRTLQGLREFGLVGSPCDLQCAFCHLI